MRLIRTIGLISTGPNLEKSTAGISGIPMPPDTAPAPDPWGPLPSEALRSSFVMRPISPVPLIGVRSMSSSRAMRRTPGLACAPEKSCIAGAADVRAEGDGAGLFGGSGCSCCSITAGAACAGDASSPLSSRAKRKSLPTRSPIFTKTSLTVPADGEGTSIEALSDSKVINGSSSLTISPGFTEISMMGTSLKSPISGTFTSMMLVKTTSLDSARRLGRRQFPISRTLLISDQSGVRLVGIDAVFAESVGNKRGRHSSFLGQRLQRRHDNMESVNFEETAQLSPVVGTAKAVGPQDP